MAQTSRPHRDPLEHTLCRSRVPGSTPTRARGKSNTASRSSVVYAEFTRDWSPVCLPYLPESLRGQRVLDLACGIGVLNESIADRGATVIAVDGSAKMLYNVVPTDRVQYCEGDATTTRWWDGEPFDGVVSTMALMDIEDLGAALGTIATVTRTRGWVLMALVASVLSRLERHRDVVELASGSRLLVGGVVGHQHRRRPRPRRRLSPNALDLSQRDDSYRLGDRRGHRAARRCTPLLGPALPRRSTAVPR